MEQNELLSIIVPVYNSEKYVSVCIESILKQTYQNIEVILVDDGSTDESGKVCDEFEQADHRVRVFHKKNGGVSSARNLGIEKCRGRYVTFIDSDDFVSEDFILIMYQNLQNYNVDISICNFNYVYNNTVPKNANLIIESAKLLIDDQLDYFKYSFLFSYSWGKLYKKNLLQHIFFDSDIYISEDSLFLAEVIKNAKSIYYDKTPLYMYRMHTESAIHTVTLRKRETMVVAWKKIMDIQELNSNAYGLAAFRYIEVCRWIAADFSITAHKDMKKISMLRNEAKTRKNVISKAKVSIPRKIMLLFFIYLPDLYFAVYKMKKSLETKYGIINS